jgi:polygalacturonase
VHYVYDLPEPNPYDQYQDFGHSHWHNSLIWGENITNVSLSGGGTVDGGGGIQTGGAGNAGSPGGEPAPGGADKLIALKSCSSVSITNLTLRRTGHFALLATNVEHLTLANLTVRYV